ncbi:TetR/AcrR family transcriptional regulator [Lachnoclostridium phytofermentans]|uniref:Transcriptional regulator, TetR family n=1 Tax=Lachnoclostridium phytofermentans (strain ATCC 700394 / DSM 18823 / ISDg) TaxID=357809 RepID=A9KSZ6_LACP7|nr:TetR/AcrR family transcriptional regulator [Lachnoclostridium phytofermentans]ABX42207.1 transcriptional regulator, TetR family [Lachnoclostridium phytofermentans ISDg]
MAREEQKIRSELIRQKILDTALEMGIEEGFEAVSIRKIIQKMKYSTGVVYHHFKDKQEILDAIEVAETGWLRSQILELLDDEKDVITNMKTVFHRILLLAFEEPEKYNLIVLHKYSRRKSDKPEWISNISRNLKEGMDAGLIKKMDSDKAAFSIWSSFLGFNLMISRDTDLTLEQAQALFNIQFDIILGGILNHE